MEKDLILEQFIEITASPPDIAKLYLNQFDYDINDAIQA